MGIFWVNFVASICRCYCPCVIYNRKEYLYPDRHGNTASH
uniref:Uncharacterized protein n=1 Tax=Triticum urartu TaxID=4572 RepID=A0A8R7U6Q3_TRIUA